MHTHVYWTNDFEQVICVTCVILRLNDILMWILEVAYYI